jgi:hypothetical protein
MTAALFTSRAPSVPLVGQLVRIADGYDEAGLLATVETVRGDGLLELRLGTVLVLAAPSAVVPTPGAVACAYCQMRDAVRGLYCGAQCANNADHVTETDWWRRAVA